MTQIVKIFLSSPADVLAEQQAVLALAEEINDVIAFLSPDLDVRLEVLRYQDNVYPDAGRPQEVVDRQMPKDFDIYLGIMWMRCGTPTMDDPSGTIHEFRQAMKRREATGRPIVMFYFSDEAPSSLPRTAEAISQLAGVMKFRDELAQIGLTMSYPDRASFRERVRGGLLRAVADVQHRPSAVRVESTDREASTAEVPASIAELARSYDDVRDAMPSGAERTTKMTAIFSSLMSQAPVAIKALEKLKTSRSAGERLAAVAVLRAFPREEEINWLAERLNPDVETPFVGYQAATALAQAVRSLPAEADANLELAIDKALALAGRNPNDPARIHMLEHARQELLVKGRASEA
ncbi:hypothetical protein [Paraburkholderia caribensis]|jgi:hypothetical protein|uniref:hypothetical protein n=1 Tax=Paraburkholderia TaxID=1822464 RepID=UPI001CC4FC2C|nr:hypothetical protein [Paraburkholderia caribensis]BEU23925.1 DUF4062 domain-containing protein [Paraburkholderia sp. 22B1P]GJH38342.1 hypothetical protein CBA19CS91_36315 [Paraburkholderia hospita]